MYRQKGMTLVEVMITLLIAGMLMAYAVPSFRDFYVRQALNNKANDMLADFAFARTEAINKGVSVRVTATGGDWEAGWEIATDANRDDVLDATDEVLRRTNMVENTIDITDVEVSDSVFFSPIGELKSANPRNIIIKHDDIPQAKNLNISLSGSSSVN